MRNLSGPGMLDVIPRSGKSKHIVSSLTACKLGQVMVRSPPKREALCPLLTGEEVSLLLDHESGLGTAFPRPQAATWRRSTYLSVVR